MSNRASDFIGMPSPANFTPDGDRLLNTNQGNPLGDQVDNSSGAITVDGREGGKPINPTRGASGHSFSLYSKPSWLCH
jgi:hypothetical protein